jgi:hypothetical protein
MFQASRADAGRNCGSETLISDFDAVAERGNPSLPPHRTITLRGHPGALFGEVKNIGAGAFRNASLLAVCRCLMAALNQFKRGRALWLVRVVLLFAPAPPHRLLLDDSVR